MMASLLLLFKLYLSPSQFSHRFFQENVSKKFFKQSSVIFRGFCKKSNLTVWKTNASTKSIQRSSFTIILCNAHNTLMAIRLIKWIKLYVNPMRENHTKIIIAISLCFFITMKMLLYSPLNSTHMMCNLTITQTINIALENT